MSNRGHIPQSFYSSSWAIRQEIHRFESVHPSIYAIYDLLDLIPDPLLAAQIRDQVVRIEDSFVNSQEWTLSRSVPDLRLGIVGSLNSGKSALVHRYLTGSYMQEESPEGGRFKKEVLIDGQSHLLLIRDEGGPPELQFSCWVDAVIFVFSLENEPSFNAVVSYYTKLSHYRSSQEIPLILVGTQDAISENNPRIIDDSRARKLASDLKRCSYYETCATYGLNVERVFQDACQKIVQHKLATLTPNNSRPSTPIGHPTRCNYFLSSAVSQTTSKANNGYILPHPASTTMVSTSVGSSVSSSVVTSGTTVGTSPSHCSHPTVTYTQSHPVFKVSKDVSMRQRSQDASSGVPVLKDFRIEDPDHLLTEVALPPTSTSKDKDLPTPSSTPTTSRKNRRRSNLFTPLKKGEEEKKTKNGEVGSGRIIPLKQGYLYKRSSKALNKEWKKKYVTLTSDGRLTYHPSLHDYMDDVHGKEIPLMHTTVKIPGQKPRGSRQLPSTSSSNQMNDLSSELSGISFTGGTYQCSPFLAFSKSITQDREALLASAFDLVRDRQSRRSGSLSSNCDDAVVISNHPITSVGAVNGSDGQYISGIPSTNPLLGKLDTPNIKKRHRRMKSSGGKNLESLD
ncbi:centaurin-gamma-1A-like, partial [Limulus polyphemus]|uniref:Centaurin-gamma-1A-like n=1 Tax=Limulus polyphemus TaxID=6850 RepID=A0ABM1S5Q1_LIMPO